MPFTLALRSLALSLLLLGSILQAIAQGGLMPKPVDSEGYDYNPIMMPDSSILLMSDRAKKNDFVCYRFVFEDSIWVERPNQITQSIDQLTPHEGMPFLNFSPNFKAAVLTFQSSNLKVSSNRYFEGQKIGGQWKFYEILKNAPINIWHRMSITDNGKYIYTKSSDAKLYRFQKVGSEWSDPEEIEAFSSVADNIHNFYLTGNGALVIQTFARLSKKEEPDDWWYYSQYENNRWTAPLFIGGFFGTNIHLVRGSEKQLFDNNGWIGWTYQPATLPKFTRAVDTPISDQPSSKISTTSNILKGVTYHALLIGINDYQHDDQFLIDLENPISDINKLQEIIASKYGFDPANIVSLQNPTESEIINQLEKYASNLAEKDNLLIVYAGHGIYDKNLEVGYWLPSDAKSNEKSSWISNSTLTNYIAGINTKHTLLISDACFSGSIFKTRGSTYSNNDFIFYKMYKNPSRKAITSGNFETVPDESVFMKYLTKYLNENENEYLPARRLFYQLEEVVVNNSSTFPLYGTIQNAGDENGDFIFIQK